MSLIINKMCRLIKVNKQKYLNIIVIINLNEQK